MKAIQPYFVTAASHYKKSIYMKDGIAHFYDFFQDSREQIDVIAVPDDCVDVMFEKSGNKLTGRIAGSVLEPTRINNKDGKQYLGVRFLPGVIPAGLKVSIKELVQMEVPVEELLSKEWLKRIEEVSDTDDWIHYFLEGYRENLRGEEVIKKHQTQLALVGYLKRRMEETGGQITVAELSEETCYTTKYIHQCFFDHIGIAPKVYAKILKFQNTIQAINADHNISFTNLCVNMGYFDQSHFNKNFKNYAAVTPKEYRKLIFETDYDHRMEVSQIG